MTEPNDDLDFQLKLLREVIMPRNVWLDGLVEKGYRIIVGFGDKDQRRLQADLIPGASFIGPFITRAEAEECARTFLSQWDWQCLPLHLPPDPLTT
jgi:hypothetical protein